MKFLKRDYSKFNQQLFVNDISSVDWTTILPQRTDVDDIFEAFYSELNRIVNVHVPLRKLSNREVKLNAKPWITKGIRISIRKKNKFYEKFIKTRQKYYESMYKSYRNKLSNLIKASKKKYYTDFFHTNTKNIKNIWKRIKEIITLKPHSVNMPTRIVTDKSILTDAKCIANAFNDFFSSVGNQLASVPTPCWTTTATTTTRPGRPGPSIVTQCL